MAKTGSTASMDPATMNNTRRFRRLYFGNLPISMGLTESSFQQIVWREMATKGLCLKPNENPILCVWFAQKKGNYGFVEFKTVEETEKALLLDGFTCMGSRVKVSRPNDYSQVVSGTSASGSSPAVTAATAAAAAAAAAATLAGGGPTHSPPACQFTENGVISKGGAFALGQQTALQLLFSTEEDAYPLGTLNLDSRVIRISNIADHSEIQDPDKYLEIKTDFCAGVSHKESIVSSRIVTLDDISRLCQELVDRDIQLEPADILLEFDSTPSLQLSVSAMSIARYDNKIPKIGLFDQDFYCSHLKDEKQGSNLKLNN